MPRFATLSDSFHQTLALGTVQFGLSYGVANRKGRPDRKTVREILETARENGVITLDTAAAYGESEDILGQLGAQSFNIITKLKPLSGKSIDCEGVISEIRRSLARLKISSAHAVLVHHAREIQGPFGRSITTGLMKAKANGLVEKIGLSIYEPSDLDALPNDFDVDIVQAPVNVFDRRIISSEKMQALKSDGTELHARSAYLQGLLLQPKAQRNAYFKKWEPHLDFFFAEAKQAGVTPLQACLGFVKSQSMVDKLIIGADNAHQLRETVMDYAAANSFSGKGLECEDPALINPAHWSLL